MKNNMFFRTLGVMIITTSSFGLGISSNIYGVQSITGIYLLPLIAFGLGTALCLWGEEEQK